MVWLKLKEGFKSGVAGDKNYEATSFFCAGTPLDIKKMTDNDPSWDPVLFDTSMLDLEMCYKMAVSFSVSFHIFLKMCLQFDVSFLL